MAETPTTIDARSIALDFDVIMKLHEAQRFRLMMQAGGFDNADQSAKAAFTAASPEVQSKTLLSQLQIYQSGQAGKAPTQMQQQPQQPPQQYPMQPPPGQQPMMQQPMQPGVIPMMGVGMPQQGGPPPVNLPGLPQQQPMMQQPMMQQPGMPGGGMPMPGMPGVPPLQQPNLPPVTGGLPGMSPQGGMPMMPPQGGVGGGMPWMQGGVPPHGGVPPQASPQVGFDPVLLRQLSETQQRIAAGIGQLAQAQEQILALNTRVSMVTLGLTMIFCEAVTGWQRPQISAHLATVMQSGDVESFLNQVMAAAGKRGG